MRKILCLLLCLALIPTAFAINIESYKVGDISEPYAHEIVLTFGGDSTLGSEEQLWTRPTSFISLIKENGYEYPFQHLKHLFESDDITVLNLEGVFAEKNRGKVEKRFNFRAPEDYAKILTVSGVEAVNIGNNHTGDYGQYGFERTTAALDAENIAWFVNTKYADKGYIFEKDGIKIGFVGVNWTDAGRKEQMAQTISELKNQGANAIIASMHIGVEYSQSHERRQTDLAKFFIENGANAVIGHHPHVLQGMEIIGDANVFYSLGNLSFGGNARIREKAESALIVRLSLYFDEEGNYMGQRATLHPVSPTSHENMALNNYAPKLLEGDAAQRAMQIIQKDTKHTLQPFVEGEGAVQDFLPAIKKEPVN